MKTKNAKICTTETTLRHLNLLLAAALAFAITLLTNSMPAAAKTTLSTKSTTIPIQGTQDISYYISSDNYDAKYTYTSSNKKIVTVSKQGIAKGLKAGKVKIKVKETVNKKTTTVGNITVNVKKASISPYANEDAEVMHSLLNQPGFYRSTYKDATSQTIVNPTSYLQFVNPKATYKIYSGNTKKISLTADGIVKNTSGKGTVKMTIKETYKKKTRTVGKIKLTLSSPTLYIENSVDKITAGQPITPCRIYCGNFGVVLTESAAPLTNINEINAAAHNGYETFDDDPVLTYEGLDSPYGHILFTGKSTGTRYIHFYMYDYTKKKYTNLIGSTKLEVGEIPDATSVSLDFQDSPDSYSDSYNSSDGLQLSSYDTDSWDIRTEPSNYTGDFEVTSSDESVIKALVQKTAYGSKLYLSSFKPGTSTITVKANGAETTFKTTVSHPNIISDGDDYEISTYFESHGEISEDDITVTSSNKSIATAKVYNVYNYNTDKSNIVSLDIELTTTESFPYDKADATVTITAQYKGKEIYSAEVLVKNDDY